MADTPETPQQRQARIRREKREAKLKANPQDRLDTITKLSGRTPESVRASSPPTPPIVSPTPSGQNATPTPASSLFAGQSDDPEQKRMQEEYMKMLFGGQQGQQGQAQGQQAQGMPDENDPMLKMMQSLLGNMSGDPNAPAPDSQGFGLSPDDISKMTGVPSFLTSMFMGGKAAPPTAEQVKSERLWKLIRMVVGVLVGIYTVWIVDRAVGLFGSAPPRPATVQNPFLVFVMGQAVLGGARSVMGGGTREVGLKRYYQGVKDVASDAAVPLFMLGCYCWWSGYM